MADGDLPDYIDETHQRIAEFAGEFLDEDEVDDFVSSLLERHGYQQNTVTTWAAPDPSAGRGGTGRKPLVKPRAQQGQGGQRRSPYFKGSQR